MTQNTEQEPDIPTLYEWVGGKEVIKELITKFYDKVVVDDLLKDLFQDMSQAHQINVAHFISEVLGGPELYTQNGGSHLGMIKKHFQKHITEEQRKRWMDLLLETADELELPDDPEFRSTFVGYLEWGTRLAVINSNVEEIDMDTNEPMPKWGWGEAGGGIGLHYAASKAGQLGMMHYYARTLAPEGVTVNAIAPALIETDMIAKVAGVSPDIILVKRFGKVEEVADLTLTILRNGYITNHTFNIDGGFYSS